MVVWFGRLKTFYLARTISFPSKISTCGKLCTFALEKKFYLPNQNSNDAIDHRRFAVVRQYVASIQMLTRTLTLVACATWIRQQPTQSGLCRRAQAQRAQVTLPCSLTPWVCRNVLFANTVNSDSLENRGSRVWGPTKILDSTGHRWACIRWRSWPSWRLRIPWAGSKESQPLWIFMLGQEIKDFSICFSFRPFYLIWHTQCIGYPYQLVPHQQLMQNWS